MVSDHREIRLTVQHLTGAVQLVLLCSDTINERNERENARVVAEAIGRRQPPPASTVAPAAGTRKSDCILGLFGHRS